MILKVILVAISILNGVCSVRYSCENDIISDQYCLISNVRINSESSPCRMSFPEHSQIRLQFLYLDHLPPALLYRMTKVKDLDVSNSRVFKAYVKPDLEFLRISRAELKELTIDPLEEYKLMELHLPENQLSQLPKHLNKLTNLTILDLSDNGIGYLDFNHLAGLQNLAVLELYKNRIHVVFASRTVQLNSLREINFASNNLAAMDITRLEAPSVVELDISNNQLNRLDHFPANFPKLRTATLGNNPWDCAWRDEVIQTVTNASWLSSNEQLECQNLDQTASFNFKYDKEMRQTVQSTIHQMAVNINGSTLSFDDIIDDIICRVYGDQQTFD